MDTALQNLENSLDEAADMIDRLVAENVRLRAALKTSNARLLQTTQRMQQASTRLRALADASTAEALA